ncbi:MAG: hypothetical protein LJF06_00870 [Gemmatimonadetes bacterium]|nr:hypothetical protein [Gemmatimonadota bacterium]
MKEAACGHGAAGGDDPGNGDALEEARELAARLAGAADGAVAAVILYGSRLLGANPDRHSALDFVVIVDGYSRFYRAMQAAGELHRPVWLLAGLSRVLPPNVIAFTPDEGTDGIAKCLVVSTADFDVGLGPRPRDHFLVARLVQKVAVIWARDREVAHRVEERLAATYANVLSWVGPWLDDGFDAEAVGRRLLEVCYRGEFRPEAHNRADVIFELQRDHFRGALAPVLAAAARAGVLRADEGRAIYRFATPPPPAERRRWRGYFRRSKVRATARWLKHVFTFDNWLPYIVRKVERRTGRKVTLTRLERRWPLIFLWPRTIRVLLNRPEREEPQ